MRIKCAMVIMSMLACAASVSARAAADEDALAKAHLILETLSLEEKAALCAASGTMTIAAPRRAGATNEWQISDGSCTIRPDLERWSWQETATTNDQSATVLPSLQAVASTWNAELAALHGTVMGMEARARGKDMLLSPGVNIMRSPLCGRNWEYYSEDPFLTASMAVPEIRGIQKCGVAACVKHFALNNQEDGCMENDAVVNDRAFYELYMPPFRAAVKDGGVYALMMACNKYNGTWCSENPFLIKGILRGRWGFEGMLVSDFGAQRSCIAAALSGGGVELNEGGAIRHFANPKAGTSQLADAVREGRLPERVVNEKVLRILYTMARTGFLDSPDAREKGELLTEKHQKAALRIAEEAVTLLKNDAQTLPLSAKSMSRILVVGRMADTEVCSRAVGPSGRPPYEFTPYKGLVEYFKVRGQNVAIDKSPLVASDIADFSHPFDMEGEWDVEWFENSSEVQEVATRAEKSDELSLDGADEIVGGLFCVRFSRSFTAPETGDFVFVAEPDETAGAAIALDGERLAIASGAERVTAQAYLEEGTNYTLSITYFSGAEGHKLSLGWLKPSEVGSKDVLREKAEAADAVLVFTGTEYGHGRAMEGEGADRPDLRLPVGHDEAIAEMLTWGMTNKLVVINRSGAPVEMPWATNCPTLVTVPYLGQEAGRAIARVLFGDVNPSGKLPATWPKRLEDTAVATKGTKTPSLSVYNEGIYVGYRWHDKEKISPLFPFGHGLSYTKFDYDMDKAEIVKRTDGPGWAVSVPVKNVGSVAGRETVQIYAAYPDAKEERPVKELKGFAKTRLLSSGESETLTVIITPRDLAYWDSFASRFRLGPGTYELLVGASAGDIRGRAKMTVAKETFYHD